MQTKNPNDGAGLSLAELLNVAEVEGLALDKQPTGYTASVFLGLDGAVGRWTDRVWASSASEAIEKALRAVPASPRQDAAAPTLCPPPY